MGKFFKKNMNKKFILLDCTLRDGGYYNNWDFNVVNIQKYLNLIHQTSIKFVELGFRFSEKIKLKGQTAYTEEKLINNLKIPKNISIGVMINASDLVGNKKSPLKICKKLLPNLKKSKIKFVRFACHHEEVFLLSDCLKWLKKNKVKVFVNIMQISEIKHNQIKNICNFLKRKTDVLYLADSLGSLKFNQVKKIVHMFKKYWKLDLGIHAHNNLNLALKNSIQANKLGVIWIDSTITGMGRGPGNTTTEEIIKEKFGVNEFKNFKSNSTFKYFSKLKREYKWGSNLYYEIAAKKKIHPTYIQKILSDKRYQKSDYKKIIDTLGRSGSKKYNPYKLINSAYFLEKKPVGKWKPINEIENKNVLIIGAGESVRKQKFKIEKHILKENLYVICLNSSGYINEKLINLRAVCHPIRMISDAIFHRRSKTKIVLPYSMLKKNIKNSLKLNYSKIFDFGLSINSSKKILVKNKYCFLPFPLALGYSLSIAISGKAKSITFAGFDGYKTSDSNQDETEQIFKEFINLYKNYKFISLTKSKYKFLKFNN
jgi:4-hydroxy 2-oxovalerate aldolase